ncbi:glycoside hydrolase family 2 protein [Flavihumibacter fluvii]|uniref:glycoside hydrolase family 2 protein n=1 Tax=Flavihumibacter fluvii TaxID=2838157 RepID=UPI001BDE64D4|nr:sugar-binding domain-containing protein [Flavihumibacter fluvii]ULQ53180.1 beta-galactosidase [Flavihumibacter fluvii]
MQKYFLPCFLLFSITLQAQNWKSVPGHIQTTWGEQLDHKNPLPEYPRPQMVRPNWKNLNGLWQYAITPVAQDKVPAAMEGVILVPFAVESSLSGVGRKVGKDSVLWYSMQTEITAAQRKGRVLLHFGAVDWQCTVFVNGQQAGVHEGGYDPFNIDITTLLSKNKLQSIAVKVWDPTNDGPQPVGKQMIKAQGIWYTSVTGIWQTVWLETVPTDFIVATQQIPDIDKGQLSLDVQLNNFLPGDEIQVNIESDQAAKEKVTGTTTRITLPVRNPKLWSPDAPYLYDLTISLVRKGKVVDHINSYFAMRKISVARDANGVKRMLLNNKFLFQFGPLDQGWWPDGLYTAPTDEALRFDIERTKQLGFNMIRKHVKVEPARWYAHCDKIGMLVWQDMPNGDDGSRWEPRPGIDGLGTEMERTPASENIYRKEWSAIRKALFNFPCIVVWVPFNEAWGQFKTAEIAKWTADEDASRLVNSASGGNFYGAGDIMDLHNYPEPAMPNPKLFGEKQVLVLGEFGGLGLPINDHVWTPQKNWGYQTFTNSSELFNRYDELVKRIPAMITNGLSAAIYTQTTDVENETNGIFTYDRKVLKMPETKFRAANQALYQVEVK